MARIVIAVFVLFTFSGICSSADFTAVTKDDQVTSTDEIVVSEQTQIVQVQSRNYSIVELKQEVDVLEAQLQMAKDRLAAAEVVAATVKLKKEE